MIPDEDIYAFLEHHGVKGMRWGSRKGASSGDKRRGFRQRRADKRQARIQKANDLMTTALKDPEVLIKLNNQQIVTGRQFVQFMGRGGLMDVRTTDIYAKKGPKGKYVLQ
jgi:hypothetical protein